MNNIVKTFLLVLAVFFIVVNLYSTAAAGNDAFKDPVTGMEFVFVKGGCYQMGDAFGDGNPNEKPLHEVCLDDFYIGKYEVTQGQWRAIMEYNPSFSRGGNIFLTPEALSKGKPPVFQNCGDNCPAEVIDWNDAQDFIMKLNSRGGFETRPYRLPTEAEWEYAARSRGKKEKYSGGNNADSVAWFIANSDSKTQPSGTKAPNGLGIYDMSGNAWEWCQDWYDENYYSHSPKNNPKGPDSGTHRVLRGGSTSNNPWHTRTTFRGRYKPGDWDTNDGFRLVFSAK